MNVELKLSSFRSHKLRPMLVRECLKLLKLSLNALTEEMLRLDPLLPQRGTAGLIRCKNRHPQNRNVLGLRLHLIDPFPAEGPPTND